MVQKPRNLKEALSNVLSEKEKLGLVKSFDIIGDIAIIDIPKQLTKKQKKIANMIMSLHKSIKTVCKRVGTHEGEYRVRPVKVIAGEKKTLALYKENDVNMLVDVNKVYFTPRLSHERERIMQQVKQGEKIGYFFAGVGPFGLVIARKKKVDIDAIEINPIAADMLLYNIANNNLKGRMRALIGDVKDFDPLLPLYDRIIMPLPGSADEFLPIALKHSKKGTIIHYYRFADKSNPFEQPMKEIDKIAKKLKKKYKVMFKRIARPCSPSKSQVVIDFKII